MPLKKLDSVDIKIVEQVTVSEPQVAEKAPEQATGNVEQIVRAAAHKYGIDEEQFVRIARCESNFNPNAINRNYSEDGVSFPAGIFQHLQNYWPARAAKYGYSGASVFDATANANVTAGMFRDGASNLWECKG